MGSCVFPPIPEAHPVFAAEEWMSETLWRHLTPSRPPTEPGHKAQGCVPLNHVLLNLCRVEVAPPPLCPEDPPAAALLTHFPQSFILFLTSISLQSSCWPLTSLPALFSHELSYGHRRWHLHPGLSMQEFWADAPWGQRSKVAVTPSTFWLWQQWQGINFLMLWGKHALG